MDASFFKELVQLALGFIYWAGVVVVWILGFDIGFDLAKRWDKENRNR